MNAGAELCRTQEQTDEYFWAKQGRLKLRTGTLTGSELLAYDRPDIPGERLSHYVKGPIAGPPDRIAAALRYALGTRYRVEKTRTVLRKGPVLINLDKVAHLGDFVEVEIDTAEAGDAAAASELACQWKVILDIRQADLVPWSYVDLLAMAQEAESWRTQIDAAKKQGKAFFLDGPSASGKTSLLERLQGDPENPVVIAPRYMTRQPRPEELQHAHHYRFLTHSAFRLSAERGEFIEYRDFDFGMSYGIKWEDIIPHVANGRCVVALLNLGSAPHIRWIYPEGALILVTASLSEIHDRLLARGTNNAAQIEERIANARLADKLRDCYDLVIENNNNRLPAAYSTLKKFFLAQGCT